MELTLIGQATVLIKMSGLTLMTDPWWGQFEFLRAVPIALAPESIGALDAMLVSHNHVDHWSAPAIGLAKRRGARIIASQKAAMRAVKSGHADTVSMRPGDEVRLGDIAVHAVPAFHPFAKDAVGFIIRGERTLYFSGDTRYTPELRDALLAFSIDVALVQTACSRYPLIGKDGMDLDDAARLVSEVKPGTVIPIHYQVKGKTISQEELQRWKVPVKLVVLEPGVPRVI